MLRDIGTHWGNIRVVLGLYGIMENKMETIGVSTPNMYGKFAFRYVFG